MNLYLVTARGDGDENLDWFVRAESKREAYELWCKEDFVQSFHEPGAITTVWSVPSEAGPAGVIEWASISSEDF